MKKRIGFSLLLALIVVATFLYSRNQLENGIRRTDYKPFPEYKNPSRTIKVDVGKKFIITLESNRTTGYGWEITKSLNKDMLKVIEIQHQASVTSRVGAPGSDSWTFPVST